MRFFEIEKNNGQITLIRIRRSMNTFQKQFKIRSIIFSITDFIMGGKEKFWAKEDGEIQKNGIGAVLLNGATKLPTNFIEF